MVGVHHLTEPSLIDPTILNEKVLADLACILKQDIKFSLIKIV